MAYLWVQSCRERKSARATVVSTWHDRGCGEVSRTAAVLLYKLLFVLYSCAISGTSGFSGSVHRIRSRSHIIGSAIKRVMQTRMVPMYIAGDQ